MLVRFRWENAGVPLKPWACHARTTLYRARKNLPQIRNTAHPRRLNCWVLDPNQ